MGALDQYYNPGQGPDFNAEYHNDLVDRLRAQFAPGPLRITASTNRVEVGPEAPYPLLPALVTLSDETEWRGLSRERAYIAFSLEGVGHLSASTAAPGGSVTWSWHGEDEAGEGYVPRRWDAEVLPAAVTVTATAYVLTSRTHGPSVAQVEDLAGVEAQTGDRRLVRQSNQVYQYDGGASEGDVESDHGGYWTQVAGETWAVHGVRYIDLLVERAYDPSYQAGVLLRPVPEADYVRLSQGTARVLVEEHSLFPAGTVVARTASAQYVDASGAPLGSVGLVLTGAEQADLLGLSEEERHFTLEASSPGRIRLTTTYAFGGQERTVTRSITIGVPERTTSAASLSPALPPLSVTPGDGECRFDLTTPVRLEEFVHEGPSLLAVGSPAAGATSLAARVSALSLSDPDAQRAVAAADTLRSVLGGGVGGRLGAYLLTLSSPRSSELLLIRPGQAVYLPGGVLRVAEVVSSGLERLASGVEVVRVRAEGLFSGESGETGYVSSNADLVSVRLRFGFGAPESGSFPRIEHVVERTLSPAGRPVFDVLLPTAEPQTLADGWYVAAEVTALWVGGETQTKSYPWQVAEKAPSGAIELTLTRVGDQFEGRVGGRVYGRFYWARAADSMTSAPREEDALKGSLIPNRFTTALAASQAREAWVLIVDGHLRAKGGTSQPGVHRASSAPQKVAGCTVIESDQEPDVPEASGVVYWKQGSTWHVALGGAWVPINA